MFVWYNGQAWGRSGVADEGGSGEGGLALDDGGEGVEVEDDARQVLLVVQVRDHKQVLLAHPHLLARRQIEPNIFLACACAVVRVVRSCVCVRSRVSCRVVSCVCRVMCEFWCFWARGGDCVAHPLDHRNGTVAHLRDHARPVLRVSRVRAVARVRSCESNGVCVCGGYLVDERAEDAAGPEVVGEIPFQRRGCSAGKVNKLPQR